MKSARIVFNFDGNGQDQLTVSEGWFIQVEEEYDDGWSLCVMTDGSGVRGLVPTAYYEDAAVEPPPQQTNYHFEQQTHLQQSQFMQPNQQQSQFMQPSYGEYGASPQLDQYPPTQQFSPPIVADPVPAQSQEDPALDKYRKMLKAGIPKPAVEQGAFRDGVTLPPNFFSDDPAPPPPSGAPAPDQVDDQFVKYAKMAKAGLPEGAVRQAALRDGIQLPDNFFSGGSDGPSPPNQVAHAQQQQVPPPSNQGGGGNPLLASIQNFKKDNLNHAKNGSENSNPTGSGPPPSNPLLAGIQGFKKENLHHASKGSSTSTSPPPSSGGSSIMAGIAGFDRSKLKSSSTPQPVSQQPPPPPAGNDIFSEMQRKAAERKKRVGEGIDPLNERHNQPEESSKPEWQRKQEEMAEKRLSSHQSSNATSPPSPSHIRPSQPPALAPSPILPPNNQPERFPPTTPVKFKQETQIPTRQAPNKLPEVKQQTPKPVQQQAPIHQPGPQFQQQPQMPQYEQFHQSQVPVQQQQQQQQVPLQQPVPVPKPVQMQQIPVQQQQIPVQQQQIPMQQQHIPVQQQQIPMQQQQYVPQGYQYVQQQPNLPVTQQQYHQSFQPNMYPHQPFQAPSQQQFQAQAALPHSTPSRMAPPTRRPPAPKLPPPTRQAPSPRLPSSQSQAPLPPSRQAPTRAPPPIRQAPTRNHGAPAF